MKKTQSICCPFLDSKASSCSADSETYTPSSFELRKYCQRPSHKKCPFYLNLYVWSFLNSELF